MIFGLVYGLIGFLCLALLGLQEKNLRIAWQYKKYFGEQKIGETQNRGQM